MSLLDRFPVLRAATYEAHDDFWYGPVPTPAGKVTPSTAMTLTAVQACVHLLSGITAKTPLPFYKKLDDGDSREKAPRFPLYDLFNYMPNRIQSAFDFRRAMTAHMMLSGNAYAQILPGPRGFADRLVMLEPRFVRPERVEPERIVYHVRKFDGSTETLAQDDIFHLRDLSLDGVVGLSRIEQAALSVGLSSSALQHGASTFANRARPDVVLSTDQKLTPKQRDDNLKHWNEQYGGIYNAGKTALLDGGAKAAPLTISNEQVQLLELLGFGVEEIARLFGVPSHLIGQGEKQTSWGTGVEQRTIEFLQFSALDWMIEWETAIKRDLIEAPSVYFAEHLVDALLRADHKTRRETYSAAILSGQMTPNQARKKENEPPREDGFGDRYWMPANYRYADDPVPVIADASAKPNGKSGHVAAAEAAA